MSSTRQTRPTDVFLYVPNLIGILANSHINKSLYRLGYVRVILAIASFYYIIQPRLFLTLYGLSCLLDVADGHAARYLGQCSRFGAVLDMVTDRSSTAGLLCHLAYLYPSWTLIFQLLLGLDLSSHYMHMYSSLSSGATSHKTIDARGNALLRLYYTSRLVLFIACALNEAFFISCYMLAHHPEPTILLAGTRISLWSVILLISTPVCFFKQLMNVIQLVGASQRLAELDAKLAIVTPNATVKQH